MSITFDSATARTIGKEAEAALSAALAKHGITAKYAGGKLDGSLRFIPKFELTAKMSDASGNSVTPEGEEFKKYARNMGLQPSDLHRKFISNGTVYRITGLNRSRLKYPIDARRVSDDKPFKFPLSVVAIALKAAEPAPAPASVFAGIEPIDDRPAIEGAW